ncbi:hypothetical protein ARMGADRAFT_1169448 [Armillaria gallica]|uniref:Uncharacterized protein n=1 Tax=Armillaria gallica TaxID=47427 RepID=A0A2H3CRN6_ARMGA|nr:hypothetical protein ARMGADRAFT_1169448 [Armillaria gallica]
MQFFSLANFFFSLAAMAVVGRASPTPEPASAAIWTDAEFDHWLATTDAKITYYGNTSSNALAPRDALITTVIYCSSRISNVCGGACTVYQGGAICLPAPDTVCLGATQNIGFCDRAGCVGDCTQLTDCILWLDGGFCYTPATRSILVSPS